MPTWKDAVRIGTKLPEVEEMIEASWFHKAPIRFVKARDPGRS